MLDPFPPRRINFLSQPIADRFSLQTLPLHVHEILLAAGVYHVIYTYLSPTLSNQLFPATYPRLSLRTRINWDIHMVSMFNSIFICSIALWVLLKDEERRTMNAEERIWGYTGAMGMTQAFAAGYFAWDTWASALYLEVTGPGALAHAVSALVITSLGFVSLLSGLEQSMLPAMVQRADRFSSVHLQIITGLLSSFTNCLLLS